MIVITNIRNVNPKQYDECWGVVRSMKNKPVWCTQVPELSPSWNLFKQYLDAKKNGNWNIESFRSHYVPVFMQEMQSSQAKTKVRELIEKHKAGKKICLFCYCTEEWLCHRSILAAMLQANGIEIANIKIPYDKTYGITNGAK